MRHRVLALLAVSILLCAPVLIAQAPSGTKAFDPKAVDPEAAIKAAAAAAKSAAAAASANWTPPRTAWGDPDLHGYWLTATYTPLQPPAQPPGKPFYTDEEALPVFQKSVQSDPQVDPRT